MAVDLCISPELESLEAIQAQAKTEGLPYAGRISPQLAWALHTQEEVRLVDVRSAEELRFVGRISGAIHVPWATGTALNRNPRFTRELESKVQKTDIVLFLCRSGKRSALAAEAATKAGFTHVFNIAEGFEGEINEKNQRGHIDGWRHRGLPWIQD